MYSVNDDLTAGFPHSEILGYNGCLSPPPGLSQTTTSFIASNCLGIHHMRLFTWSYNLITLTYLLLISLPSDSSRFHFRRNDRLSRRTDVTTLTLCQPSSLSGKNQTVREPLKLMTDETTPQGMVCLSPDNTLEIIRMYKFTKWRHCSIESLPFEV